MERKKIDDIKLGDYILDIAAGPFGSNLKVDCFVNDGFPIIDGANLRGFKVTDNITKYVSEVKARSLHRSIARRNDVIVTISGNVGQISYIPSNSKYEEYLVSQRQFRVTFDTTKVYVPYLIYYFHTKVGQHKILSFANQTGVPALAQPLKNFRNIDICFPELRVQKRIASILDSLDSKIELNNRINHNLEEQAQALYKSWFVDFEPFKDGKFIESELGMIPDGWSTSTIQALSDRIASGGTPKSTDASFYDGPVKWFTTKELKDGFLFDSEKHISKIAVESSAAKVFPMGTVLMAIYASPTVGRLGILTSDSTFNQASVAILPKHNIGSEYIFLHLLSERDRLNNLASGAAQQNLNVGIVKNYPVLYPTLDVLISFNNIIKQIFSEIRNNSSENCRLTKMRDSLLSKLMSGELKINEIDC